MPFSNCMLVLVKQNLMCCGIFLFLFLSVCFLFSHDISVLLYHHDATETIIFGLSVMHFSYCCPFLSLSYYLISIVNIIILTLICFSNYIVPLKTQRSQPEHERHKRHHASKGTTCGHTCISVHTVIVSMFDSVLGNS